MVLRLVEDRQLATAAPLGEIHRLIGVIDELVVVGGVAGEDARAERGADLKRAPLHGERLLQHCEHPRCDLFGGTLRAHRVVRKVVDEQQELVAAVTADINMGLAERPQPARHEPEQFIAGRVPERVVDPLERVDIDHHKRRAAGLAPAPRYGRLNRSAIAILRASRSVAVGDAAQLNLRPGIPPGYLSRSRRSSAGGGR